MDIRSRLPGLLLLVGVASIILVAVLVARLMPGATERSLPEQTADSRAAEPAAADLTTGADLPVPLARIGHLMSIGSLIRDAIDAQIGVATRQLLSRRHQRCRTSNAAGRAPRPGQSPA